MHSSVLLHQTTRAGPQARIPVVPGRPTVIFCSSVSGTWTAAVVTVRGRPNAGGPLPDADFSPARELTPRTTLVRLSADDMAGVAELVLDITTEETASPPAVLAVGVAQSND